MRTRFAFLALFFCGCAVPVHASWVGPFISELHYDNAGGDIDEFVAITGPSGWDLSGWQIALYNGADGRQYRSLPLTGVLDDTVDGLGEAAWSIVGIQNGPDAVALVSPLDLVVDFIAYEAAVTATDGAAQGAIARLLPVEEGAGTPIGWSLQRTGSSAVDAWVAALATPGIVNPGLIGPGTRDPGTRAIPSAAVAALWLAGLAGWRAMTLRRRPRPCMT